MRLLLLLAVATPLRSAPQYGGSASVPALQPPAPQVSQQCRTEQQVRPVTSTATGVPPQSLHRF